MGKKVQGIPADRLLFALSNPIRLRMVKSLLSGPGSAKTLSRELGLELGNVSYHLSKVLYERCDLVELIAKNPRRGAEEKVYRLTGDACSGITKLLAMESAMQSDIHGDDETSNVYSFEPVAVDKDGQREIVSAIEDFKATVDSVTARCSTVDPANLTQMIVGNAAFEATPGFVEEMYEL